MNKPSDSSRNRRSFLVNAAAALPAAALLSACGEVTADDLREEQLAGNTQSLERARGKPQSGHECHGDNHRQRKRWRQLVDLHMGEENQHDLPGVMATFAQQGEMIFNRMPFRGGEAIAAGHVLFGMSQLPGALVDTQVVPEREHYTDAELLIEGRVIATHVGDVLGFVGTGKHVSLPYAAFYRFDAAGKLVSERIVMDWSPLAQPA